TAAQRWPRQPPRVTRGRTARSACPCGETSKKNGRPKAPVGCCICGFLEAVRHARKDPSHVRTEDRSVALRQLGWSHAGPRELGVSLVIDLRVFDPEARALGEAVLIAEAPLLGTRFAERDRAG